MITKIEDVKTIEELIDYVNSFCLPINTESICFIQDIVGHTEVGKLEQLAKTVPNKLYPILYNVWGWEDFTAFWNRVSNFEHNDYQNLKGTCNVYKTTLEQLQEKYDVEKENNLSLENRLNKKTEDYNVLTVKINQLENEIIRLKAKLYDELEKKYDSSKQENRT